jgi:hypothetical protein
MEEVNDLLYQLRSIRFNEDEITEFLTLIYNSLIVYNQDVESQIAQFGNYKYIDAFSLLQDILLDENIVRNWMMQGSSIVWDANALNYINFLELQSVVLTYGEKSAINTLFIDLKSLNSTWDGFFTPNDPANSKLKCLWISKVGDGFKYNLVDPRDVDDAYRLSYGGNPTITENGMVLNGTTQYANTHYNTLNKTSICTGVWLKDNNLPLVSNQGYALIANTVSNNSSRQSLQLLNNAGTNYLLLSDNFNATSGQGRSTFVITRGDGFFASSVSGSAYNIFKDGLVVSSGTRSTYGSPPNLVLYLGAQNKEGTGAVNFLNNTVKYAFIAEDISPEIIVLFYSYLYKYDLGVFSLNFSQTILQDTSLATVLYSPITVLEQRHGCTLAWYAGINFIFFSEDDGVTYPYSHAIIIDELTFAYIFSNKNIYFATRYHLYFSYDKLNTINEVDVLDLDGINIYNSVQYTGCSFKQAFTSKTISYLGEEIVLWGNYTNIDCNGDGISDNSPVNLYWGDNVGNVKIIYQWGRNAGYKKPNGDLIGNSDNPLYCRHIHFAIYDSISGYFYMNTGDENQECHFMRGNLVEGVWTWVEVFSDWNWGMAQMILDSDAGYITGDQSTSAPIQHPGVWKFALSDVEDTDNWVQVYDPGKAFAPLMTDNAGEVVAHGGGTFALSKNYGSTFNTIDIGGNIAGKFKISEKNSFGYYRISPVIVSLNGYTVRNYGNGTVWIKIK